MIRCASHSGSWYSKSQSHLDSQLSKLLNESALIPLRSTTAIIVPHAGYAYSAPTAACSYASIDVAKITTIFILGPSHHVYLSGCALSPCKEYATPFGNLDIDENIIGMLKATGQFSVMSLQTDEAEHSIEMQLPFIKKIMNGMRVSLVPILVGDMDRAKESRYAEILLPYLGDESCLFVISSDFCHWGDRFGYTYGAAFDLPIYESIKQLDQQAMDIIAALDLDAFKAYLKESQNTICGRNPVILLLHALQLLDHTGVSTKVEFLRYEQSSQVKVKTESSVSYVAASIFKAQHLPE